LPVSRSSGASSATDPAERAACLLISLISAQRPGPPPGVAPCQRENPVPKEWAVTQGGRISPVAGRPGRAGAHAGAVSPGHARQALAQRPVAAC
jgi:hypothetical protein